MTWFGIDVSYLVESQSWCVPLSPLERASRVFPCLAVHTYTQLYTLVQNCIHVYSITGWLKVLGFIQRWGQCWLLLLLLRFKKASMYFIFKIGHKLFLGKKSTPMVIIMIHGDGQKISKSKIWQFWHLKWVLEARIPLGHNQYLGNTHIEALLDLRSPKRSPHWPPLNLLEP